MAYIQVFIQKSLWQHSHGFNRTYACEQTDALSHTHSQIPTQVHTETLA